MFRQDLWHGRAGDEDPVWREPGCQEISAGVFGVAQVNVGDGVHNPAVDFLWHPVVKAAIACLHVKNGNLQPFGGDGGQAGIGIPQEKQGVRPKGLQKPKGLGENVSQGVTQVGAGHVQLVVWRTQVQILEEDFVEGMVPVLTGVDQGLPEVSVTAPDGGGQPDDFRTGPHHGHEMKGRHGLHLLGIGIRVAGIKAFAGPQQCDQIGAAPVFYGMGIARRDIDGGHLPPGDREGAHLPRGTF